MSNGKFKVLLSYKVRGQGQPGIRAMLHQIKIKSSSRAGHANGGGRWTSVSFKARLVYRASPRPEKRPVSEQNKQKTNLNLALASPPGQG